MQSSQHFLFYCLIIASLWHVLVTFCGHLWAFGDNYRKMAWTYTARHSIKMMDSCIPVKQKTVASCSFVICWCMFPLQSVRNLQQCRKCHTNAVSVGKWQVYWVTGPGRGVQWYPLPVGTKHRMCAHPQTDCACVWCRCGILSAGVEMVLLLCKWWANAWTRTVVADHQHQTQSWVTQHNGADRHVLVKQAWKWCSDFVGGNWISWTGTQVADHQHQTQSWVTSTAWYRYTDTYWWSS